MSGDRRISGVSVLETTVDQLGAWFEGWSSEYSVADREFINRQTFDIFLALIHEDIVNAFATESDPRTGEKWKSIDRSGKILYRTGELYRLALAAVQQGGRNSDPSSGSLSLSLSSPVFWWCHQFGTSTIQARPFFGASHDTIEKTGDSLLNAVAGAMV